MIHDFIGSKGDANDDPQPVNTETESNNNSQQQGQSNSSASNTDNVEDQQEGDTDGDDAKDDVDNDTNNVSDPSSTSRTQNAFDESMRKMTGESKNSYDEYVYVKTGQIELDKYITSIETVRETIIPPVSNEYQVAERGRFNEFIKSIKGDVNHMVQQFEMKKSADAYARQQTHKTGVLDTNRLHNYKLSDDLFLRQSLTPDGKCHGMVMYLDWSGSMCEISHDTVKQIITLVQFCRKVQIPFDVYLFTTGDRDKIKDPEKIQEKTIAYSTVALTQVLTSDAKKKQIDDDLFHLWCASRIVRGYSYEHYLPHSPYFSMGGTPLDVALVMVPELIKQFRQKTGAQKVSFVCITDGESAPLQYWEKRRRYGSDEYDYALGYCYYQKMMLRSGHHVFPIEARSTGDVVNWVKTQVTDVAITNLFLGKLAKSSSHLSSYGCKIDEKKFRKNGSHVTKSDSWPLIGVINPTSFTDTTTEIDIEAGSSKAKIKSALNKMLKTKQSSRLILTELVGEFA